MQPFTQKYTLIQLLEDVPEGAQYDWRDWPLHVTLADVFAIDWDVPRMIEKLTELLADCQTFTTVAADDALFGPQQEVRVVLIEKTDGLAKLHADIVTLLEQGGVKFNSPQYVRDGFLPHSTVQKHGRLQKGDHVTFNAITLVDMFPDEDPYQRKILKTIKIGR